jgi:hypothetical protein
VTQSETDNTELTINIADTLGYNVRNNFTSGGLASEPASEVIVKAGRKARPRVLLKGQAGY